MAAGVTPTAVSVATSATLLAAADPTRRSLVISVPTGGAIVYIGGSGVTTSTGTPVAVGTSFVIPSGYSGDTSPCYAYYGIVAASTQDTRVLTVTDA